MLIGMRETIFRKGLGWVGRTGGKSGFAFCFFGAAKII